MPALWTCSRCGRAFRQKNQRHSCGVGSRAELLARKPEALVRLYAALEKVVNGFDGVEIVARGRYVLLRTSRIFADVVFMRDALRIALLLDRKVEDPLFFKIGAMRGQQIAHVTKVRTAADLRAVTPFLREAYRFARQEDRP
jgi:hypothetical protein